MPVLDRNGRCFGIIGASDIFKFIATGGDSRTIKAWEICTHTVIYVHRDITAIQACQVMRDNHIHHLIIGDAAKPTGIVSTMDIVDELHKTEMAEFAAYGCKDPIT